MAQLTDLNKVRKKRARRKLLRNLALLALFAAGVYGISSVVYQMGDMDIRTAMSNIKAEVTTGDGFPVTLSSGRPTTLHAAQNTLVLLTDTNICTYNHTGRKLLDVQHGMANLAVSIAGERIMAYDRGSRDITFYSRASQVGQNTMDFPIYDADISRNGNYAVATESDRHLARVSVYNDANANIFNCYSADRPVIAVSLADSKDAMVVGYVDVSGGMFCSSIGRFQFNVEREINSKRLEDELILSLEYSSGNEIRAITDKRVVYFDNDFKQIAEYPLQNQQIIRFQYDANGRLFLLMKDSTGVFREKAVLLDAKLREIVSFEAGTDADSVVAASDYLYLCNKNGISIRDLNGNEKVYLVVSGLYCAYPIGNELYYATAEELNMLNVKELIAEAEAGNFSGGKDQASSAVSDIWQAILDAGKEEDEEPPSSSVNEEGGEDSSSSANPSAGEPGSSQEEEPASMPSQGGELQEKLISGQKTEARPDEEANAGG